MIVVGPVSVENPSLGVHLRIQRCVGKRGEDERKSCLQAIFYGEFCKLVEDCGGVLVKTYNERAHDTDVPFMKTTNAIGIFSRTVRKLVDGIDRCLGK